MLYFSPDVNRFDVKEYKKLFGGVSLHREKPEQETN
jgi:hypothetical protein